jgi:chromosome segregation ATPase
MSAMSSLRNENKELREQNEKLSEQATKGQEGEAQIIVLRNKLEASREELQRVRSGNELELQSTRMEAAALKKALQQAEMDQIRSEQVLRREKEMQETIDRFVAQLNEKDRQVMQCCSPASHVRTRIAHLTQVPTPNHPRLRAQILELQDELDRASSTVAASTGEAHSRGEKVADLERRLRHEKNRSEEVICIQDRACVCLACRNLDALQRFTCCLHFLS